MVNDSGELFVVMINQREILKAIKLAKRSLMNMRSKQECTPLKQDMKLHKGMEDSTTTTESDSDALFSTPRPISKLPALNHSAPKSRGYLKSTLKSSTSASEVDQIPGLRSTRLKRSSTLVEGEENHYTRSFMETSTPSKLISTSRSLMPESEKKRAVTRTYLSPTTEKNEFRTNIYTQHKRSTSTSASPQLIKENEREGKKKRIFSSKTSKQQQKKKHQRLKKVKSFSEVKKSAEKET